MNILKEANDLIYSARPATYDHPAQNFKRTANIFTGILKEKLKDHEEINEYDVAMLMIGLKMARLQHQYHRDSVVDIAGYAGCMERIFEYNSGHANDG